MQVMDKFVTYYVVQVIVVLCCTIHCILGRRFPDEGYSSGGYYNDQLEQYAKIKTALGELEHAPQYVDNWPNPDIKLGQVSGVALDAGGRLLVFHRAGNTWDGSTFTARHVYQNIGEPPIPDNTVMVFNDTGELVDMWGKNLFYMPHGITVDKQGNVWVTDVALHQVFKFTPQQREQPALVLGEKFVPGNDERHFCKPSAVAVLESGDFFVADGYCNTRIMKFGPDGELLLQWGGHSTFGNSPFAFNVPHALTLAEDRGLVCVADRERGRVACFRSDNGTYVAGFKNWLIGPRLFSVAYAPARGGRLYVVNGPMGNVPVRGYVIDFTTARLIGTFAPETDFRNPHDVVTSADGSKVYVAELNPYRVYKFEDEVLRNETKIEKNMSLPVKPTTTIDQTAMVPLESWGWWRGAGGAGGAGRVGRVAAAAAGAAGAALLALAAVALRGARNKGRKGVTRRRWEYGHGEFKLRRLLERRRFTRVHSEDSDEEPAPMLPQPPANA